MTGQTIKLNRKNVGILPFCISEEWTSIPNIIPASEEVLDYAMVTVLNDYEKSLTEVTHNYESPLSLPHITIPLMRILLRILNRPKSCEVTIRLATCSTKPMNGKTHTGNKKKSTAE